MNPTETRTFLLFLGLSIYVSSTLTSMAGMSIGFGVLVLGLVAALRTSPTLPWTRSLWQNDDIQPYRMASLALGLACWLSLCAAWAFPVLYSGQSPRVHWLKDCIKLGYLMLPFLVAQALAWLSPRQVAGTIRNWLIFSGVISAVAIPQFFTGWPRPQAIPGFPNHFHATLFFGHHLSTASILIFPLFISASLAAAGAAGAASFFNGQKKEFELKPRTLGLIAALAATALFLTWSRTLWIALPIGIGVWLLRYLNRRKAIALIIAALSATVLAFSQIPQLRLRMLSALGTSDRFELWSANLHFFEAHPWTGIGWRKAEGMTAAYFQEIYGGDISTRFVGHAHNNFLEMLSGTGLIGTVSWLVWTLLIFQMSLRVAKRRDFWGEIGWGFFCAWIVFQINGLTQVNLWEGKALHQVMWGISLLIFAHSLAPVEQPLSKTQLP